MSNDVMTVYRFTIHDDAGLRVDDRDDEMTEAQLDAALANCDEIAIDGRPFWKTSAGEILSYISEEI